MTLLNVVKKHGKLTGKFAPETTVVASQLARAAQDEGKYIIPNQRYTELLGTVRKALTTMGKLKQGAPPNIDKPAKAITNIIRTYQITPFAAEVWQGFFGEEYSGVDMSEVEEPKSGAEKWARKALVLVELLVDSCPQEKLLKRTGFPENYYRVKSLLRL